MISVPWYVLEGNRFDTDSLQITNQTWIFRGLIMRVVHTSLVSYYELEPPSSIKDFQLRRQHTRDLVEALTLTKRTGDKPAGLWHKGECQGVRNLIHEK
jgi:hypothetical protein